MKDLKEFNELQSNITTFVQPVKSLTVGDFQSAQTVIDAVKEVKAYSKEVDKVRRSLVEPLNKRVKEINDYAKDVIAPLNDAEIYLKGQLIEFEKEQERLREIERQKLLEEQRKKEEELKAKQEREKSNLEQAALLFGEDTDTSDVEEKHSQEQACLKLEKSQAEWDIKQQGIKNARKIWKVEVLDISKVPDEYLIKTLNEKAVLALARAGVTQIPGLKIYQETNIAIGTYTYVPRMALKGKV